MRSLVRNRVNVPDVPLVAVGGDLIFRDASHSWPIDGLAGLTRRAVGIFVGGTISSFHTFYCIWRNRFGNGQMIEIVTF